MFYLSAKSEFEMRVPSKVQNVLQLQSDQHKVQEITEEIRCRCKLVLWYEKFKAAVSPASKQDSLSQKYNLSRPGWKNMGQSVGATYLAQFWNWHIFHTVLQKISGFYQDLLLNYKKGLFYYNPLLLHPNLRQPLAKEPLTSPEKAGKPNRNLPTVNLFLKNSKI